MENKGDSSTPESYDQTSRLAARVGERLHPILGRWQCVGPKPRERQVSFGRLGDQISLKEGESHDATLRRWLFQELPNLPQQENRHGKVDTKGKRSRIFKHQLIVYSTPECTKCAGVSKASNLHDYWNNSLLLNSFSVPVSSYCQVPVWQNNLPSGHFFREKNTLSLLGWPDSEMGSSLGSSFLRKLFTLESSREWWKNVLKGLSCFANRRQYYLAPPHPLHKNMDALKQNITHASLERPGLTRPLPKTPSIGKDGACTCVATRCRGRRTRAHPTSAMWYKYRMGFPGGGGI